MSEKRPKYTKEWLNDKLPYIQITAENKNQVSALLDKMGFVEYKTYYKPNILSILDTNEYCFCAKINRKYPTIHAADFIADNIHLLHPEQPVLTSCPPAESTGWELDLKMGAIPCDMSQMRTDQQTFEKFANPELGEPIAPASPVHQPNHYMKGGIEVGKFISAKELNFNRGQAIKYICRAGLKDQNKTIEDLQKAIRSLQMEVEFLTELNEIQNG